MILSNLNKCNAITWPYFFPILFLTSSSSGVNDITITKDLVNNTYSWSRLTRRWTRNSSRCCTSADWICSNLSFRIETPDTSWNCPKLRSKSRRNRFRYLICRPRQNCNNKHNIITTTIIFQYLYQSDAPPNIIMFVYTIYILGIYILIDR